MSKASSARARKSSQASSGWARPLGWARPIYINRHPQPPAKYIGLNGISKVTNCYRMLHKKKRGGSLRPVMFNLLG